MRLLAIIIVVLPLCAQVTPKTQVCNSSGSACAPVTANGETVQGAGTAGAAAGGVVTIQGSASGTPVPVSGTVTTTPPANASTNVTQFGSNNVVTGTGASGNGIPRVTISNDSSLAANQSVNIAQVGGATPDPCFGLVKSFFSISQTASARIITGTSAKKIYFCAIDVVGADAENISFVEGTGSVCATSTIAVPGFPAATAANGWNFAAGGGIAKGSGVGSLAGTSVNADDVCVFQSGSGRVAGGGSYVVQ